MKDQNNEPITLQAISEAAQKRVALITQEFRAGFEFIKNYPRSVTFFGSARTSQGDKYYEQARSLAAKIVENLHYAVTTGGGPGIMEAANRGAYEAGGNSIGLNIELPHEQATNKYLTDFMTFHYFFSRKVCLSFSAEAYIFFPGGFGTLDEFLEILTLVQTRKIPEAPIILVGAKYWTPLVESFFKQNLELNKYIDSLDLSLFTVSDDEQQILEIIKSAPIRIGLTYNAEGGKASHNRTPSGPISELSSKHCVPCEGGALPLSRAESEKYLQNMTEWMLIDDKKIEKTYEFQNFDEAFNFLDKVAHIAEKENHHPDLNLHDYKKVTIKISTHAIDGLSENDFILASKIDQILR